MCTAYIVLSRLTVEKTNTGTRHHCPKHYMALLLERIVRENIFVAAYYTRLHFVRSILYTTSIGTWVTCETLTYTVDFREFNRGGSCKSGPNIAYPTSKTKIYCLKSFGALRTRRRIKRKGRVTRSRQHTVQRTQRSRQ